MSLPLHSAFAHYKSSYQSISRDQWKTLFFTYLFFTLFSGAVLSPLLSFSVQVAVSLSGESALSDTQIAAYLFSPSGAVIGLVVASLALALGFLSYAAILITLQSSSSITQTLQYLAKRFVSILKLTCRFTISIILTVLPFLTLIGFTYLYFMSDSDINYYLAEKPPEFLKAVGIAGVIALTMGFTLVKVATTWFLALPHLLFSIDDSNKAKIFSKSATQGQKKSIAACIGIWLFGTPLLIAILTAPIHLLANWLVPQLSDRLPMLALVIGGSVALTTGIAFCSAFVCFCLIAHRNVSIYRNANPEAFETSQELSRTSSSKLSNKAILALSLLAVVISGTLCYKWIDSISLDDDVLIIAHRGSSIDAPENTLAAIKKAVEDNADWVEIDVQETADGEVVVFHDSDFKRVGKTKLNIWDAQSSELPKIEIGTWFDPSFNTEFTPTLSEVLEVCKGKSGVLIELKYYGHDVSLEQRVIDIVEKHNMADQVMVMSLKYEGVQKVRKLRPDWKIGLLSTVALGDITKLDVDFLGLNSRAATPKLIKRAHASDIDVFVWTINNPLDISAMTSRGVDGLITDTPTTAHHVLEQRAELPKGQRLLLEIAHTFGRETNELIQ